jgi:hypothetical protein
VTNQQMTMLFDDEVATLRAKRMHHWNSFVRTTLPSLAKANNWPISRDHCFMRVCLDTALAGPWHLSVKRPAIRHLSDDELEAAIRVAESIVAKPETLAALNKQSLAWRKATKRAEPQGSRIKMQFCLQRLS